MTNNITWMGGQQRLRYPSARAFLSGKIFPHAPHSYFVTYSTSYMTVICNRNYCGLTKETFRETKSSAAREGVTTGAAGTQWPSRVGCSAMILIKAPLNHTRNRYDSGTQSFP
jgi:hypothetical protein